MADVDGEHYEDDEQEQQSLHGYGADTGAAASSHVAGPNSKCEQDEGEEEEELRRRLEEEREQEDCALRELQAKEVRDSSDNNRDPGDSSTDATQAANEEVDSRSIYVGNVDYGCTPEEVQAHFQSCGTVNRVTILTDRFGQPKGFSYVEFLELEAVQNALLLNESELHGRQLKVSAKRTNIPGMRQYQGRQPNRGGFRSRRPFIPGSPPYSPHESSKIQAAHAIQTILVGRNGR
ncbi:Polyadenylate-binding protein 1-like protein [Drosera capensis]